MGWIGWFFSIQFNLVRLGSNPTQPITCVKSENQHDSTYHMELLEKKKKSTLTNNMIFMILIIILSLLEIITRRDNNKNEEL